MTAAMKLKYACALEEKYDKPRQHIKRQRHHFVSKGSYSQFSRSVVSDSETPWIAYSQSYGFSSSHVQMWESDYKEVWGPTNWCLQIVVLEKTLESLLDHMEIKLINPKGNLLWIFIRRTDAKAEAPIIWPPDWKSWLTGKDPDAGKDWGEEEQRVTEDEMFGWHHQLNAQGGALSKAWASSGRWWRTGKPGVLQSMGL